MSEIGAFLAAMGPWAAVMGITIGLVLAVILSSLLAFIVRR